ncbi:uncharacterized protein PFL1_05403 [Pseudozyma flocculosa PF-1]|uniref:Glycosyl transferase CAP10 domain-containing protein n=1 Tax=Pseudozyma flocculosa PF-1 TaxID=1277687 RepID=A0A061H2Z7_9BASI|nr:uncharacterized protein PFL1_05403 [Pseudozyma flocculosa PF-1]EPQ27122.1 hypothetical protein PFL1_05403 [Pseudozyma flocculosa PF-1]
MSEKSTFLSPSMSPSSSSSGGNAPPPYRFHQLPQTPTGSRTPSRPGSPPHGGSVPSPGGVPGTFVLNLGKYGGFYVIRIPTSLQRVLGLLLRRWKTLVFVALFGTLAAFGIFGAMSTEWREMTYYRVDPYPIISHGMKPGASSPFRSAAPQRPIVPPKFSACLGPKGVPVPRAPLETYDTPDSHPIPLVGSYEAAGMDPTKCMTYRARYEMYTDDALGITYRKDPEEIEDLLTQLDDYDDDPDNVKPIKKAKSKASADGSDDGEVDSASDGAGEADGSAASQQAFGAKSQSGDKPKRQKKKKVDPLYGPEKPAGMSEGDWERHLRDRLWRANLQSEELGPSSYPDWKALMDACYEKRTHDRGMAGGVDRFDPHSSVVGGDDDEGSSGGGGGDSSSSGGSGSNKRKHHRTTPETKRTALVMRAYEGYPWREDDILNMRALISELSLNNPNTPYDIRILVEVHGRHLAVFTSEWDRLNVLRSSVPREFWGMVELWTEDEMCALYPGLPGKFLNHMIAQSSYRSCLMALQKFYLDHQEYDFIYNWEMDVRYVGNYLDFFEGIEEYSRNEPLHVGMDKYDTWLVPNVTVSEDNWADNKTLTRGRGQEADLITLGPIFDPRGSGWYWEYDVQNYPPGQDTDRRASIGTNMRMSRHLLEAMNVVNAEAKKSLHCEAWPTTLVLHSQLPTSHAHSFYPEAGFTHNLPLPYKGVFVPHPVYFRHFWDPEVLHSRINRPDFYKKINERVMRDSSFYYDGKHSKEVYMGWKEKENVCRAPMLLHPIKRVN